jgi:flavodoxin
MIFYFSGTGNSKWIAEQIAKAQNEVLVFMPNAIRDGIEEFVLLLHPTSFSPVPSYPHQIRETHQLN